MVHYPRHLDCRNPKATVFCNQLDVIKTYQNHNVSLSPERILSGPNFQNFDLRHQNFLRIFLPFVPLGSARGLPRAAAPEAKHRCTWQPGTAAIRLSSGSSRRRRPWMHRTNTAVASEEDLVGKPHEALGFRCEVSEDVDGLSVLWILFITSYVKWASVTRHLHQHFLLFGVITILSFPKHPLASSK